MPGTSAASVADARGSTTPLRPILLASSANATPPRTGRVPPLSPSSPVMR